jgi:hypothetical protein
MELYTFFAVSNIKIQFLRFEFEKFHIDRTFINVILFEAIDVSLDNGKGFDVDE